ncbi:wee1-like protein kinase [Bacillus rossius redtenbacheri]|uniref:wee1-like protein kinase n=1 Tax=Bacillus rossius redtenbacheri TaxID=93214 RepID=UPI002FDEE541
MMGETPCKCGPDDMRCVDDDMNVTSSGSELFSSLDTSSEDNGMSHFNPETSSPNSIPPFVLKVRASSPNDKTDGTIARTSCRKNLNSLLPSVNSPPYKRVRALQLYDVPETPKTILRKCVGLTSLDHNTSDVKEDNSTSFNTNPFTPKNMLSMPRKRARLNEGSPNDSSTPKGILKVKDDESDLEQPTKRFALKQSNISRYHQEFLELGLIGRGSFCSVYKCLNRLDGCLYAIKKSIRPLTGSINEKRALNEVYAHAVMGRHQNVVCYFSAWAEDNHMYIQNEFCNGGSLAEVIKDTRFTEAELHVLLHQLAEGVNYIHSKELVHLDIKPENVFICQETQTDEKEAAPAAERVVYKIGDLGNVTSLNNPQVEEGDCRYLTREILQEDYSHLTKADVFSLGLTIYEAGGGGPLPKNGEEWHAIRDGQLSYLRQCSREFNDLLRQMIDPQPSARPSAVAILYHPVLVPPSDKSKRDLLTELETERLKRQLLEQQLQEALRSDGDSSTRQVGYRTRRSQSSNLL